MIDFRTATFCYPNCTTPEQYLHSIMNHTTSLQFDIMITVIPFVVSPIIFWLVGKRLGWIGDKVPKELRSK